MTIYYEKVNSANDKHISSAAEMVAAYYRCSNAISLEQYDFNYDINSMKEVFVSSLPQFQGDTRGGLYVVSIDGEPKGFTGFVQHSEETAEIKYLYVKPECRGKGLGNKLLQKVLEEAKDHGFSTITIVTPRYMKRAYHLLECAHFTEYSPSKSEISLMSEMFHYMRKSL